VVEQLAKVIDVSETDMVMMHAFLLRELIAQPSPRATERLIELAFDARTPPELMTEVRKGLASRRNGAEHMLEALGRRYDFLAGVLMTPPVGPLADALAAMKETRAAPLLAEHLNDPANSTDDVKRAALALETLATQAEREPLELFFSLYRATAHNEDLVQALVAVARAILRVGGNDGRELVRAAAYDLMTVPSLQQPLRDLVSGSENPRTKGP
jgi:outer membrane protein assembly factor BamB